MKRYAIIENEKFAMINLRDTMHKQFPEYECIWVADSVEGAVQVLRNTRPLPDLIFMDIELNDGNCFEIFQQVQVDVPIIFTTAYDQYALRAFQVNSIDYLLKPIAMEALQTSIGKFESRIQQQQPTDYSTLAQTLLSNLGQQQTKRRILIQSGDNYSFCYLDEVDYFIRDERYVYAAIGESRRGLTDFSNLRDVELMVDSHDFFQLSRNVIVNAKAITKVSRWFAGRLQVIIGSGKNEEKITVSSARKAVFLEWLGR